MSDSGKNSKPRLLDHLKTCENVLIVTNGQYTETNYFNLLLTRFKSPYSVTIKYIKESSPHTLIDKALECSLSLGASYIWVVFDSDSIVYETRDKTGKILAEALEYARKCNVDVALSCMAFEVWLIAHFTDIPIHDSLRQIEDSLSRFITLSGGKSKYEKNDKEMIDKYFIRLYRTATISSKKSYQNLKKNFDGANQYSYLWDFGNYTTVWDLVEFLQLEPKTRK